MNIIVVFKVFSTGSGRIKRGATILRSAVLLGGPGRLINSSQQAESPPHTKNLSRTLLTLLTVGVDHLQLSSGSISGAMGPAASIS